MFRFFFHRDSKFVVIVEVFGLLGLLFLIFSGWIKSQSVVSIALFYVYLLLYLFLKFCIMWNWYGSGAFLSRFAVNRSGNLLGIMLHFKKTFVPVAYVLLITNLLLLAGLPGAILIIPVALYLFITHVNVVLIYLHLKDKDKTLPNFFTGKSSI